MKNLLWLSVFAFTLFSTTTFAHPGYTNASGCHHDELGYHCHPAYGKSAYTNYTCHTNHYSTNLRYGYHDPRSLTYSCNGGNGYNTYNNYHYRQNLNYQTYYGNKTYHTNSYYPMYTNHRYMKFRKSFNTPRIRQIYGNQILNYDRNTPYYSVPTRSQNVTMRNYHTWPYTR